MVKGKKTRTAVYHPPPFLVMTVSPEGVTPRLAESKDEAHILASKKVMKVREKASLTLDCV